MFQRIKERYHRWRRERITQRTIKDSGGIPESLEQTFPVLTKLLKPEGVEKFRAGTEDDAGSYHFGLGMWMRNNWGLWGGGKLKEWFISHGIQHADDMSGIILTSYWRHLNNVPIELDAQIAYYRDYWRDKNIDPDTMKELPRA